MKYSVLISSLFLIPLLVSMLCFACRGIQSKSLPTLLHVLGLAGLVYIIAQVSGLVVSLDGNLLDADKWFHLDYLGLLFLCLLGLVAVVTGIYSIGYMNHELDEQEISHKSLFDYYGFFHLFVFTMMIAICSNNIILMWVAIEATTLSSAFLVGFYKRKSSFEAAWKYIIICSVGVAFGLYGTILVYSNAVNVMTVNPSDAVFWTELIKHPELLDGRLMQIAFMFVLIGFGTKMGLFPMHSWLPDAHSEAPSPASALLSAMLLNCALLIVIRFYILISGTIGTGYPSLLLTCFGVASVAVAAFLIVVQKDIKRLLAYSSVENMGLIAVAIGIGGPLGIVAALLHTINHSIAKALLFCGSGNVVLKYKSRDMGVVSGMLKLAPLSAVVFAGGALGLAGMPPFNVFLSEFILVTAGLSKGHIALVIVLLLLLTVVLAGLVRMVAKVLFGKPNEDIPKGDVGWLCKLPIAFLLVLMLIMGTSIPTSVVTVLEKASAIVLNQPAQTKMPIDWLWAAKQQSTEMSQISPETGE